jgi:hypothetical protein
VRRRVRADAGQREQALGDLVVRQSAVVQLLEIELARGDVVRQRPEVRAAVAGADDIPVERLVRRSGRPQ